MSSTPPGGPTGSCLEALAEAVCGSECATGLACTALRRAVGAYGAGDVFCLYSRLRLAFEAAVQYAYYWLQGLEWEKALARIRHRSRFAASFTATMIKELRGVHGSRKRWLLHIYLSLGAWLHPSIELHEANGEPLLDEELVGEVLDAIAYTLLVAGCSLPGLEDKTMGCGFEKTGRLLARRSGSVKGNV
ncbi:hypothetical protein [Hyperthermus butylicus]|uniref:Uncharacterized protein n=1 Tax=Hyperthermus butylicus (strain DSM 5456 / JCM 9403 / PLM1-5) TaxID=415426 RepID=A2BMR7_HYPBU|nr:hypothetical protein [Hyperthermus butylicus]ABM81278.1 hypothetical protein Hbut_1454 [Hyperthermus butylicus DSM 5456]